MSGLKVREKDIFLKAKDGKFFLSSDKDMENPYDQLTGIVTKLKYDTIEYNGAEIELLKITIRDSEGNSYSFSLNIVSNAYRNFVGFLGSADLSSPITIEPKGEALDTGKISTSFFIKQDGQALKSCFPKKDEPGALPAWNKIRLNGKDVWDKTDFLEAIKQKALEISSKIESLHGTTPSEVVDTEEDDTEDLPF